MIKVNESCLIILLCQIKMRNSFLLVVMRFGVAVVSTKYGEVQVCSEELVSQ